MNKTLGQKRVRVNFNPSKDDYINDLKVKSAELIDLINGAAPSNLLNDEDFGEFRRLKALALTAVEEACMWAVKMETINY